MTLHPSSTFSLDSSLLSSSEPTKQKQQKDVKIEEKHDTFICQMYRWDYVCNMYSHKTDSWSLSFYGIPSYHCWAEDACEFAEKCLYGLMLKWLFNCLNLFFFFFFLFVFDIYIYMFICVFCLSYIVVFLFLKTKSIVVMFTLCLVFFFICFRLSFFNRQKKKCKGIIIYCILSSMNCFISMKQYCFISMNHMSVLCRRMDLHLDPCTMVCYDT